ncbi:DUF6814 family protein [Arcticibacter sp. MXS-1]|uniref:DUF6814 family protein n=1 Tax=Arcticibacter sp. MXS-1 TaxID=3341726 RepID=UPI0035A8FD2C
MNTLKKYLGIVWILAGLALGLFLLYKSATVLSAAEPKAEDFVFWIVILVIFVPIVLGFVLFGYYAWRGEYS